MSRDNWTCTFLHSTTFHAAFLLKAACFLFVRACYPCTFNFQQNRRQEDYWIACFVLLSRVPNFEDLLLLRLPDRKLLSQLRPEYIRAAYALFIQKELRSLDSTLRQLGLNANPHSFASPSYSCWTSASAPRDQSSVSGLRRARSSSKTTNAAFRCAGVCIANFKNSTCNKHITASFRTHSVLARRR